MKANKSLVAIIMLFILITTLLSGCTSQPTGRITQENEIIEIGVINGMTGKASAYGQKVFDGLEIAQEEINRNNLANNKKIMLIHEDSQSNAQNALNSFNKLINLNKVSIIIGPLVSDNVLTVAPVAEKEKTLLFITVAGTDKIKDAGDYIFRNRVSASALASYFANYLYNKKELREISIVFMNSGNGYSYKQGFSQEFKKLGGKIVSINSYEKGEIDFKTTILKLKTRKVKDVFIAGYTEEVAMFLKQSKELDFKTNFVASPGVESDDFIELAGVLANGVIFCTESVDLKNADEKTKSFVARYKARTGKDPDFFSLNSYDALMLIIKAGNKYGFTSEGIKKGLYEIKDYQGVSGKLSFDENGEVLKDFAVKEIKNGEFVFVN